MNSGSHYPKPQPPAPFKMFGRPPYDIWLGLRMSQNTRQNIIGGVSKVFVQTNYFTPKFRSQTMVALIEASWIGNFFGRI